MLGLSYLAGRVGRGVAKMCGVDEGNDILVGQFCSGIFMAVDPVGFGVYQGRAVVKGCAMDGSEKAKKLDGALDVGMIIAGSIDGIPDIPDSVEDQG